MIVSSPTEIPGDGDDPGYFWIEEYPVEPPQHILNSFGVGLYRLLAAPRRPRGGLRPLCAAITTIEDNLEGYQVPSAVSWYDLAGAYRGNAHYHSTHINQLKLLHSLSSEEYFAEMAETFREDHPYEAYRPDRPE